VFYITLGSGVGGGMIVDGTIYHGAIPGEAEIGHIRLDGAGTTLESRCSGWAVDARLRQLATAQTDSVLATLLGSSKGAEAKSLAAAWQAGDPAAQKVLQSTAKDLAFGLSHVVHLFHPQIIIMGGGLSGLGKPLRDAVASALQGYVMEAFVPGLRVALTSLGEDAVPVGALDLARQIADDF
jgi:glucokinase